MSELWLTKQLNRLKEAAQDFLAPENAKIKKLLSLPPETLRGLLPKSAVFMKDVSVLFDYQNKIVRLIVKSIKYKNNAGIRKRIAGYLCDELIEISSEISLFEGSKPILAPIPMSRKEKTERGFNQCEELCREIKKMSGDNFQISFNVLKKVKETKRQTKLSRDERMENIKGSMAADSSAVRGRSCIVLDDVYTTGASFAEARRALIAAGARSVFGLFIAH